MQKRVMHYMVTFSLSHPHIYICVINISLKTVFLNAFSVSSIILTIPVSSHFAAMELALSLERLNNEKLLNLHSVQLIAIFSYFFLSIQLKHFLVSLSSSGIFHMFFPFAIVILHDNVFMPITSFYYYYAVSK